jgi:gluconolactonase
VEKDGRLTVLADKYEGKRLNSPIDVVYRSDGTLFFTDLGLPKFYDDPAKSFRIAVSLPSITAGSSW